MERHKVGIVTNDQETGSKMQIAGFQACYQLATAIKTSNKV